jgi:acyl-homoserine lactone acylase PvdQ
MSLAHFYGERLILEAEKRDPLRGMDLVEHLSNPRLGNELVEAFAATVAQLDLDFGTWKTPWGEINRLQRLDGAIEQNFDDARPSLPVGMASGKWGALASFGAQAKETKRIYGTSGNSFVAVVEFGDRLRARSLLAGGQSGQPSSPHFMDQAQRYVDHDFKEVAFFREDVERRAERTYQPE